MKRTNKIENYTHNSSSDHLRTIVSHTHEQLINNLRQLIHLLYARALCMEVDNIEKNHKECKKQ